MLRAPYVGAVELLGVAAQADVDDLAGLHGAEGVHDRAEIAARVDVLLSGAVAPFAARLLGRFLAGSDALEVWIGIEALPDLVVLMAARAAAGLADVFGLGDGADRVSRGRGGRAPRGV